VNHTHARHTVLSVQILGTLALLGSACGRTPALDLTSDVPGANRSLLDAGPDRSPPVDLRGPDPVDLRRADPVDLRRPDPIDLRGPDPIDLRRPDPIDLRGPDRVPDVGVDRGPDLQPSSSLELVSWVSSPGGLPIRVLEQNQVVYLGDWEMRTSAASGNPGGIHTYDVSDPTRPIHMSTISTPPDEVQDLAIQDHRLVVANDALGLRVVDISDPARIRSIANRSNGSRFATAVAATIQSSGGIDQLYALAGYLYGGGMAIYEMASDGTIPTPDIYYSEKFPRRCDVHQIQVRDSRAYILASDGESNACLEILDLTRLPGTPTAIGRACFAFSAMGGIGDIRVAGDYVYYSASDYSRSGQSGGLRIFDVRDPKAPVLAGRLDLPAGSIDWKGTGLAVANNTVYFVTSTGVLAIDVTSPSQPFVRAKAPFPTVFGPCQGGTAAFDAGLLYVGAYCRTNLRGGLAIYRVR
jgi:hypothetical protein